MFTTGDAITSHDDAFPMSMYILTTLAPTEYNILGCLDPTPLQICGD
jgi:hypothetical protein